MFPGILIMPNFNQQMYSLQINVDLVFVEDERSHSGKENDVSFMS